MVNCKCESIPVFRCTMPAKRKDEDVMGMVEYNKKLYQPYPDHKDDLP